MKTFSEIKLKTILNFYIERRARRQDKTKYFICLKKEEKNLFIFVMIGRRDRLSAD